MNKNKQNAEKGWTEKLHCAYSNHFIQFLQNFLSTKLSLVTEKTLLIFAIQEEEIEALFQA